MCRFHESSIAPSVIYFRLCGQHVRSLKRHASTAPHCEERIQSSIRNLSHRMRSGNDSRNPNFNMGNLQARRASGTNSEQGSVVRVID